MFRCSRQNVIINVFVQHVLVCGTQHETHLSDGALTACEFPLRWNVRWGSGFSSSRSGGGVSSAEPLVPSLSHCRPARGTPPGGPAPCLQHTDTEKYTHVTHIRLSLKYFTSASICTVYTYLCCFDQNLNPFISNKLYA